MTGGRGPDGVIDAVGMEAHGAPLGKLAQTAAGLLPDAIAAKAIEKSGVDRMEVLHDAIDTVRRGGTLSISGVYGGQLDPIPMMQLFDKGIQMRMGQAHVKRWIDDILPLIDEDDDPLGVDDLATHRLPLDGRRSLRDVPEEGGRRDQGRPRALKGGASMSETNDRKSRSSSTWATSTRSRSRRSYR